MHFGCHNIQSEFPIHFHPAILFMVLDIQNWIFYGEPLKNHFIFYDVLACVNISKLLSNYLNRYKISKPKTMFQTHVPTFSPCSEACHLRCRRGSHGSPFVSTCTKGIEINSKIHLDYLLKVKPKNSAIVEFKI